MKSTRIKLETQDVLDKQIEIFRNLKRNKKIEPLSYPLVENETLDTVEVLGNKESIRIEQPTVLNTENKGEVGVEYKTD